MFRKVQLSEMKAVEKFMELMPWNFGGASDFTTYQL